MEYDGSVIFDDVIYLVVVFFVMFDWGEKVFLYIEYLVKELLCNLMKVEKICLLFGNGKIRDGGRKCDLGYMNIWFLVFC